MSNLDKQRRRPLSGRIGKRESFGNPEKPLPVAECIVTLGRGIEQVPILGRKRWKPTRYIQTVKWLNDEHKRFIRTTERKPLTEPEDENTLATGGGTANTLATVEFFDEMRKRQITPSLFILAAGRPGYLKDTEKKLTEGGVMREMLNRRLSNLPETVIFTENQNTHDDVLATLTTLGERGLNSVIFINTEINMRRLQEFYKNIVKDNSKFREIRVFFLTAEDLIKRRFANNPHRAKEWARLLRAMRRSEARNRIDKMEKTGLENIHEGTYGRGDVT